MNQALGEGISVSSVSPWSWHAEKVGTASVHHLAGKRSRLKYMSSIMKLTSLKLTPAMLHKLIEMAAAISRHHPGWSLHHV